MSEGNLQPSDVVAESRIISSIFEEEMAFDLISDRLKSEHFFSYGLQVIYEAMEEIRASGDEITMPSVSAWLKDSGKLDRIGGDVFLEKIYNETPAMLDPDREAERVIVMYRLREGMAAAKKFVAVAPVTSVAGADDLMGKLVTDVSNLSVEADAGEVVIMKEAVRQYAKEFQDELKLIEKLKAEGLPLIEITTGLTDLDDLMSGLHRGDLTVIAARPGMGKSALGYKFADECARRKNYSRVQMASAFFSLEMPKKQVVIRGACMDGRIDLKLLRDKKLDKDDWSRYFNTLNNIAKLPIYIVDKVTSLDDIERHARKLKLRAERDGFDLVVVVIDYLQLVSDKQSGNQTRENLVSSISRRFKLMANNLNLAVVLLAQLNRDCEQTKDKRPKLHNLRESGSIEQDADNVIFMFRSDYYKQKEWEDKQRDGQTKEVFKPKNEVELNVAKQRNGPTGTVECRWTGRYTRIDNLSEYDKQFGSDDE